MLGPVGGLEEAVDHEDRRSHPHRQRDGVARPAIQAQARTIQVNLGVIDLIVNAGDDHAVDVIAGLLDKVA